MAAACRLWHAGDARHHRYPSLLDFLAATRLDLAPMIARRVGLSDASAELARFDAPAPPGIAVITDFAA
jgi:threonine dehydrogenase-like Zn-dependent dehydrogenase